MTTDLDELERLHREATQFKLAPYTHEFGDHESVGVILCAPKLPDDADAYYEVLEKAARAGDATKYVLNAMPALIAELRALRARVAAAEAEAAAEFAERKRVAEALRASLVEANEKALEHLEARMRAEAERDALREVAAAARIIDESDWNMSGLEVSQDTLDKLRAALAKVPR